ncbi:MAG: phosphatidate cytidylyltransferase [Bacteroidetes bacterium]|nr:phosphatidate cytidylyltransferase [Bacteroidota bacterium]
MPINRSIFSTRVTTSFFFVAVMLTALLWNDISFWMLMIVIHAGCWVEFQKIIQGFKHSLLYILLGLVYITLSWVLFLDLHYITLHQASTGLAAPAWAQWPLVVFVFMWINDTMAYIVGTSIGKTPLSIVSPKKTWEGTIGGILLTLLAGGAIADLLLGDLLMFDQLTPIDSFHWYIIALVAAIAGTLGDLFESKLKRMAGIKDSGSILPGHGGFLDRFDSILITIPVIWLYIRLFLS